MTGRGTFLAGLAILMALPGVPGKLQAQVVLIEPGVVNQIELAASSVTMVPAIDIPVGARHLRLQAISSNGADIDLLLRYGEPFPRFGHGSPNTFGGTAWLYEHSHYFSRSRGPSESLVVTPYQPHPLRAGRWYLALVNYHTQATRIDITATVSNSDPEPAPITVDFNDAAGCAAQVATENNGGTDFWFDNQATTPVEGNAGTTLGEQRRNAFNHAMEQIRRQTQPIAPIHIRACWASLGGDAQRATLASAGPYLTRSDKLFRDDRFGHLPALEKPYTWHALAAAAQSMGTDSCRFQGLSCTLPRTDVFIQFNRDVGSASVIGGSPYFYGYNNPPPQSVDFIATAMHEIIHGLGFLSLLNTDPEGSTPMGAKFRARISDNPTTYEKHGHNDAYSDALVLVDTNDQVHEVSRLPDAERGTSLTAGNALRWADPAAVASHTNPWRDYEFPVNLPRLFAPDPVQPGSSVSHLNRGGQMMAPFITQGVRDMGLAAPMLSAVGWNIQRVRTPLPEPAFPYGGQWYDPTHDGHGIDLQRVVGTADTYFLILYSYDAEGNSEWFTSVGRIVDGVFRPGNNAANNSLWRFRSPGVLDQDIGGQIRIDFANASQAPECNDGGARDGQPALMDFSIRSPEGTQYHRWCLTQLLPREARPTFDSTGTWYGGESDSGWGISTLALPGSNNVGMNAIVYYFDDDNQPRWALGETANYQPGQEFALHQVSGYCRACDRPAGGTTRRETGRISLGLRPPQGSDGTVSVSFQNAAMPGPGVSPSSFRRTNVPLILLGESSPAGD